MARTDDAADYVMTRDGWADGRWRRAGETLRLRPRDAAHEPLLAPAAKPRRRRRAAAPAEEG